MKSHLSIVPENAIEEPAQVIITFSRNGFTFDIEYNNIDEIHVSHILYAIECIKQHIMEIDNEGDL